MHSASHSSSKVLSNRLNFWRHAEGWNYLSRKFVSPLHMHANPLIVTQRLHIFDIDRQPTIFRVTQRLPIIAHVNMHANRCYRHTTFPYCRHRQETNYVHRQTTFPYYRSREHARKPLLSAHNVSLLSTSTGNQLFSAPHNVSLLSLTWICTQTAFIVTQRLPIVDIDRQPFRLRENARKLLLSSHNISSLSTSTGNQLFLASDIVSLFSLKWTCTQTAVIVTQRLPIVDIDRQLNIFSVTQGFPIIAHVNMLANSLFLHTTTSYHRSRHHEALHR